MLNTNGERTTAGIPIACNLSGAEQASRQEEVADMFAAAQRVNELADGYAFRYPASTEWANRLMEFILAERSCCPFFTFELVFEANQDSVWLRLRGADGVRDYIKAALIPAHIMSNK